MGSRWCSTCADSWPTGDIRCPQCRSLTRLSHAKPNHSKEEAEAALDRYRKRVMLADSQAKFDRYYARREEKRIAQGHLAPEGVGKREAKEIIRLEKGLAA